STLAVLVLLFCDTTKPLTREVSPLVYKRFTTE
ncbi:putative membrane protein, partial [Vibrio parahaemolyticus EKP-028]